MLASPECTILRKTRGIGTNSQGLHRRDQPEYGAAVSSAHEFDDRYFARLDAITASGRRQLAREVAAWDRMAAIIQALLRGYARG